MLVGAFQRDCLRSQQESPIIAGFFRCNCRVSTSPGGNVKRVYRETDLPPIVTNINVYYYYNVSGPRIKLAILAIESFGCLGKEGSDLIDQAAASIVGGTDASSL